MTGRITRLTVFGILLLSTFPGNAQTGHISYNAGVNPWEGVFVGFDYKFNRYSVGVDAGSSLGLIFPAQSVSLTIDNNFYFGSPGKFGFETWHANARLGIFYLFKQNTNKPLMVFLIPAIGKEFYITSKLRINVDIGLDVILSNKDTSTPPIPTGTIYEINNRITPDVKLELKF